MFVYSKSSLKKLKTCDEKLQELFLYVLLNSPYDIGISCGHRTVRQQQRLYSFGRTNPHRDDVVTYIDGIKKKSKHNLVPSQAVDIMVYDENNDVTWDTEYYKQVGKVVLEAAKDLDIPISWGGNWRRWKDYPHFELKKS